MPSGFNDKQWDAIIAPTDEDILISAGAGSGKTKTLSERVRRILLSDELKPSELLVLTFTNNAAHEMKERILSIFNSENGDKEKADKLISSHIQTFDSLYQYLVSLYAPRLGLSSSLNILSETLAMTKKREIIDEIFDEYYADENKKDRLIDAVSLFDMKNDKQTKWNVLCLWGELEKLAKKEREEFVLSYDERFLSFAYAKRRYHEIVEASKEELKEELYKGAFAEYFPDVYASGDESISNVEKAFSSRGFWGKKYDSFSFQEENYSKASYDLILSLLNMDDEAFVKEIKGLAENYPSLFSPQAKTPGLSKEEKAKAIAPWKVYKAALRSLMSSEMAQLDSLDEEYQKLLRLKEPIHLFFEIIEEASKRLIDYKKSTSSFTFSDFAEMALSLLTESQYQDVASEIRERFRYIMVDEYQDTNPSQEAFLEALLLPKKDGTRSHLFVVGDAKQSIYQFRGSVVELFKERENRYSKGIGHRVISMNTNYRSGPLLLEDINYVCSSYMRNNHGAIDYKNDEKEHLLYDSKVNLYKENFPNFGIHRLITPNLPLVNKKKKASEMALEEACAIVGDIKKKIDTGYLVYDAKKKTIRPCRPSDFAILMRVKGKFSLYEKLFAQVGIKLNKILSTNLHELDAIVVLESLLKMEKKLMVGGNEDTKHLFASIARSYLCEYDDDKLYHLLYDDSYLSDPLFLKLQEFASSHKDEPLHAIFLNLVEEFNVVKRLYRIGRVEDNISKIESLYTTVLELEKNGKGLVDFVTLFANMNRYAIPYNTDSLTKNEDAVDMMTIHASKGLERKIVYLPNSVNYLSNPPSLGRPDFSFSLDKGIAFPDYSFDIPPQESIEPLFSKRYSTLATISEKTRKNDPVIDDHVRLFYVALTRAENEVIIVGDPNGHKESLYDMLNTCPHTYRLNEAFFAKKIEEGYLTENDFNELKNLSKTALALSLPLSSFDEAAKKEAYESLGSNLYLAKPNQLFLDRLNQIALKIYEGYEVELESMLKRGNEKDIDFLASLFADIFMPSLKEKGPIHSFSDFLKAYRSKRADSALDSLGYGVEEDDPYLSDDVPQADYNEEPPSETEIDEAFSDVKEQEWWSRIRNSLNAILEHNYLSLKIKLSKDVQSDEEKVALAFMRLYFSLFAKAFDGASWVVYESYENKGYGDRTEFMNELPSLSVKTVTPTLSTFIINNAIIEFEVRNKKKASKTLVIQDDDNPIQELLAYGTKLHRYMELVDLKNPSLPFIKDSKDKRIIEKVLSLPIMQLAKDSEIHAEYGYYDRKRHSTGSIDLLFIHENDYYIVDYKTKNITDPAYREQLEIYQDNVSEIFHIEKERIHCYLLSLLDGEAKQVL